MALSLAPERGPSVAQARDIETVETAFFVGQRRPLERVPGWKGWVLRAIYFAFGWSCGDDVEGQAVCTSLELAKEMANKPGWFYLELPINTPLPDEMCHFKAHDFPSSEVRERYEARTTPIAAVRLNVVSELKKVSKDLEELTRAARAG